MILTEKHKQVISTLVESGITNKLEQAHFLAQTSHESGDFSKFSEGTNYRYSSAKATFCPNASNSKSKLYLEHKRRLDAINEMQKKKGAKDSDFVPQPFLFNTVYGSRMGNEDDGINDNDGFDHRGLGILQLTGFDNQKDYFDHLKLSKGITIPEDQWDDYLVTLDGAIDSAIWFWKRGGIGKLAIKDDVVGVSKAVNGGTIGLDERKDLTIKFKKLLGV